jgi:hypothetical protein
MTPRQITVLLAGAPLLMALWRGAGAGHHPQAADDVPSEVASVWFDQLYDLVTTERVTAPLPRGSRTYRRERATRPNGLYGLVTKGLVVYPCSLGNFPQQ